MRTLLAALSLGLVSLAAQAVDIQAFSASTFNAAQEAGKPVAVHFHADWCPTCRVQQINLRKIELEGITVLSANFDTEKALRQAMGVKGQSTLVVFKGKKESGRLLAETSPEALRKVLSTAL
jgi:thioredoxin 1